MNTNILWFRNDLRIADNPALIAATADSAQCVAIYYWVEEYENLFPIAPVKADLIRRRLCSFDDELKAINIPLIVFSLKKESNLVDHVETLCEELCADSLYFNNEYPFYERRRDKSVTVMLREKRVKVNRFDDRLIFAPRSIRNLQGDPYRVFTPFKKKCLDVLSYSPVFPLGTPSPQENFSLDFLANLSQISHSVNVCLKGSIGANSTDVPEDLWSADLAMLNQNIERFILNDIDDYHKLRDFPGEEGTSKLSPYLAIGMISSRQLISKLFEHFGGIHHLTEGANVWFSEIIWREFYQHLIIDFPSLSRGKPMQEKTVFFPWKGHSHLFDAWARGETGFPIVDAAMKQLLHTGWMHNRLRMITASFLTKNLQIDWRLGERFFMEHLVDGDFAANNGGWQWSASTGADASPYFRVFNPVSQSERFDKETSFICEWLPELALLPAEKRHNPCGEGYIPPIVDLKSSRAETIALFSQL